MAPPKRPDLNLQDHEYAIRALTSAVEALNKQCEENENTSRSNKEEILVLKTKLGFVAVGAGLLGGGAVTAVVRMLTH